MQDNLRLGKRIRALRRCEPITQAALAKKLGISASYLNLIEHDKRPMSAPLLIKLAQIFDLDLKSFGGTGDAKLRADLLEALGDPLFDSHDLTSGDVHDFVSSNPEVARAVLHLYHGYQEAKSSVEALATRVMDRSDFSGVDRVRVSTEQVSDLIQRNMNYFPDLEERAQRLWKDARLADRDLFEAMAGYLDRAHGVRVRVARVGQMQDALRRFDAQRNELVLSEVLRRGTRNFQLAHQIGLLECPDEFNLLTGDAKLISEESRALCRISLANYFAAAVLMPYDLFLRAAQQERYDLDLLGHRFRTSFEQVCHRLTSLHRPGAEGVSFHMVRVDIAGNISKKYSGTGQHFPMFSGLCPLWNVHAAFLRPGEIRTQLSQLPDSTRFFSVARTVRKHRGGYNAPNVVYSIGLGCSIEEAPRLVYADGVDLTHEGTAIPVGMTCRLCERMDCQARAFPPVQRPLRIDENIRRLSFYTPG